MIRLIPGRMADWRAPAGGLLVLAAAICPLDAQTVYYVSETSGNDGNSGGIGSPLATIQEGANRAQAGDIVAIRAGTYRETVTVPRSGSSGSPITFQAYNGENVILSCGDLVTGWAEVTPGSDIYRATVTWNANNDRDANTLFVDGVLQHEARQWAENDILDFDDWGILKRNGSLVTDGSSFVAEDLTGWGDDYWNGAMVRFHTNDWTLLNRKVTDYRSSDGKLTLDSPVGYVSQKQDNGYYLYDFYEALDQPGEWYKGKAEDGAGEENRLYYMVAPGQDPATQEVEFKMRDHAFDVRGRDHIRVHGLTFRGAVIQMDTNTDHNLYDGNVFHGYGKAGDGRFWFRGAGNVFRDNEVFDTYSEVLSLSGEGNEVVNNHLHDIGFGATTRVLNSGGTGYLISHNTVDRFARSFLDGYPLFSEICYNVIEDGGNLSWDTGVFDSDGGNGDSSYSIFHHNVIRNTNNKNGIFETFYGKQNNAVIHHNLIYDFKPSPRPVFVSGGLEFRQAYHNTFISDLENAPQGNLNADEAVEVRYNNNLQISLIKMDAFGVDTRGSHNYSTGDFVDFANDDYRLSPGSGAIDIGVVLPGINDGFAGAAPDAGALEFGEDLWPAGHNFASPPNPVYAWEALPGTNLFTNGQFTQGIGDWTIVGGTNSLDRNSWNLKHRSLTGTVRTRSVEFAPGDEMSRTFTGLKPGATYTVGAATRIVDEVTIGDQFNGTSGSIVTGEYRDVDFVTDLTTGEWVRYDNIDFGDLGQFDRIEILYSRLTSGGSIGDTTIELRLGSPTGQLLGTFTDLVDPGVLAWMNARVMLPAVSGNQSIYLSASGATSAVTSIGHVRLLKAAVPPDDQLTVSASSSGAPTTTTRMGWMDWISGYDTFTFTTGPAATSAVISFANEGRIHAYLDRLYVVEKDNPGTNRAVEGFALRSSPAGDEPAPTVIDGVPGSDRAVTGDEPGSWMQVDLGGQEVLHGIRINASTSNPGLLNNVRVSVWATDPRDGGSALWEQDFLTDGQVLQANETLVLHPTTEGLDGKTLLRELRGRYVRLQLLGPNSMGDERLAVGEIEVRTHDWSNLASTEGAASQSSTTPGLLALRALDGDRSTLAETNPAANSWWQVSFSQRFGMGHIEIFNRDDSRFGELSNFSVSVWDVDPDAGGVKLWEKAFYSTGSVEQGGSLLITADEVADDGFTRLGTAAGKVVRIQLNGLNNAGNGSLSLAEVRVVRASDGALPVNNVALLGTASQSSDHYVTWALAEVGIDGVIYPEAAWTHTVTGSGNWWQVDLGQTPTIDQIVVANAGRDGPFELSVWDGDPDSGGSKLWSKHLGTVGVYESVQVNGSETWFGLRLDQVSGGRFIRIDRTNYGILSLTEVQVWVKDSLLRVDPGLANHDYHVGAEGGPINSGWGLISSATFGDVSWSGPVAETLEVVGGINRGDVHADGPRTLSHALANGVWEVTMNLGSQTTTRDDMMVWAEGQLVTADLDAAAGAFPQLVTHVSVLDGALDLQFDDAGGSDPSWALNRLSLDWVDDEPPVADPVAVTALGSIPAPVTLTGSDPDGDGISFHLVTQPAYGSLVGTPPNLTYTADPGHIGPDTFTYVTRDAYVDSPPAAVSITVSDPDADSDGDGLSDSFELTHYGHVTDHTDGTDDLDGDGMPDAHEIAAGTDPTDPASRFGFTANGITGVEIGGGTSVTLEWFSVPGRSYSIWVNSHLAPGGWTLHTADIPGSAGTSTSRTLWVAGSHWFFRIGVQPE